jgi:hypothetical protein
MVTDRVKLSRKSCRPPFHPIRLYKAMRERSPALFLAPSTPDLTGYDEAYTALRRHDVFSSRAASPDGLTALSSSATRRDTPLRSLVNKPSLRAGFRTSVPESRRSSASLSTDSTPVELWTWCRRRRPAARHGDRRAPGIPVRDRE